MALTSSSEPGRVLDHVERGNINFEKIKTVVLDEADQMLNMGFQEDVEKVRVEESKRSCRLWEP